MGELFVLVVDDESLIAVMIEDIIQEGGFKTVTASSGEMAIQIINNGSETFSALVTDVNLGPGCRGWEVARRAREVIPAIPVVYVTGDSEDDWTSYGVPHSILIRKPFASAQILAAVTSLMNSTPLES